MITQERLKKKLSYDPETGDWVWFNCSLHNTRRNGQIAGNLRDDGYRLIRIDGTRYYSSRLAFLYMTGKWPKDEVDHIDRDPSNDRWNNLREATSSMNKFNTKTRSSCGYRGVYPCGNRWQVMAGGCYLGLYDSLEEAIIVRDAAAVQMAGDFAVLNERILT